MFFNSSLTTSQILDVFTEEINARHGSVHDLFHDGRRLFARSILPHTQEVRPGDQMKAGVALKATDENVCLYPFLCRVVCSNGAIMAESLQKQSLENLQALEPQFALQTVREGIEQCCEPKLFQRNVRRMSNNAELQINLALQLLPILKMRLSGNPERMLHVIHSLFTDEVKTVYDAINVITAIARETRDPEQRWDLEELGGELAVGSLHRPPRSKPPAARTKPPEAVAVS